MQVILLERIRKLGQMGEIVTVKDGFARNYLLPQKKAMRATKANMAVFETQRAQLEARNLELKTEAEKVGEKLDGQSAIVIRQAGDTGQLYGSVSTRDIAEALTAAGFTVTRTQVLLEKPIKALGVHEMEIQLHPEVLVKVTINVARTEEEAERQARGEDLTMVEEETLDIETYSEDDDHDDQPERDSDADAGESDGSDDKGEA